jgi:hypothetical protein
VDHVPGQADTRRGSAEMINEIIAVPNNSTCYNTKYKSYISMRSALRYMYYVLIQYGKFINLF